VQRSRTILVRGS